VSDQPMPGAAGQEPSEEEVRAYLGQLRGAPVEQVVAEVVSALLNAAQVKLGRRDGRLLLDLAAANVDGARAHLPEDFTEQVDQVVAQLRMAQVEAEREVAEAAAQGHAEPSDLDAEHPTGEGGEAAAAPPSTTSPPQQPQQQSAASRLWVPGR
jgi:hypothetical protein